MVLDGPGLGACLYVWIWVSTRNSFNQILQVIRRVGGSQAIIRRHCSASSFLGASYGDLDCSLQVDCSYTCEWLGFRQLVPFDLDLPLGDAELGPLDQEILSSYTRTPIYLSRLTSNHTHHSLPALTSSYSESLPRTCLKRRHATDDSPPNGSRRPRNRYVKLEQDVISCLS